MVNWDLQRQIWEHSLKAQGIEAKDAVLLVTEPLFNFPACQEGCQQVCECSCGCKACWVCKLLAAS